MRACNHNILATILHSHGSKAAAPNGTELYDFAYESGFKICFTPLKDVCRSDHTREIGRTEDSILALRVTGNVVLDGAASCYKKRYSSAPQKCIRRLDHRCDGEVETIKPRALYLHLRPPPLKEERQNPASQLGIENIGRAKSKHSPILAVSIDRITRPNIVEQTSTRSI